ncbi:MAG: 4-hydroxy-tetrahydrodipicolinate synthase [Lentisphaerae bacterium]|nr:4-hydroxy-tetrahydrodipicolinate synthase [Lentisphaerota bacterium]
MIFEGTYTALVTPFNEDGSVDYDRFRSLIDRQAEAGVTGVVPVGTTGESPTLTYDEHRRVVETAVDAAAGRIQVIAGTGANSTAEALDLTRHAKEIGADATLQITPYYNKPSQEGLYRHFSAVAEIGLPVVLYNVPGRTSREIAIDTVVRLSELPGVVALKEAGESVDRVSDILDRCDILVLSGDDSLTLPMMSVGAKGVISVASNVAPAAVVEMTRSALKGQWEEARQAHMRLYRLFRNLFIDTNPIPVKAAMAMMGLVKEVYRLPLCSMNDDLKATLKATLETLDIPI